MARRVQNGGGFESRSLFFDAMQSWDAADLQAPRTLHTRLAIAETDTMVRVGEMRRLYREAIISLGSGRFQPSVAWPHPAAS
jgi:hypothetical protein